jgi:DNA (cytosine-5)-methyltransferase 1
MDSALSGDGRKGKPQNLLVQPAIIFDFKQSGEADPTMRSLNHDQSHANGGSHLAVATFDERNITSKANRSKVEVGAPCHTLHSDAPTICLEVNKSANEGSSQGIQIEHTNALRTDKMPAVCKGMGVRRLTPRECERLQGFPDSWTDVPYRGKQAADGPRYRALGNSMAVPCMFWIGKRIQMVEEIQ